MTPATTRMLAAAMASARRQRTVEHEALRPLVQVEHNQITVRGVKLTDAEMGVLRAIAQKLKEAA
jgi:hypothetical protein